MLFGVKLKSFFFFLLSLRDFLLVLRSSTSLNSFFLLDFVISLASTNFVNLAATLLSDDIKFKTIFLQKFNHLLV